MPRQTAVKPPSPCAHHESDSEERFPLPMTKENSHVLVRSDARLRHSLPNLLNPLTWVQSPSTTSLTLSRSPCSSLASSSSCYGVVITFHWHLVFISRTSPSTTRGRDGFCMETGAVSHQCSVRPRITTYDHLLRSDVERQRTDTSDGPRTFVPTYFSYDARAADDMCSARTTFGEFSSTDLAVYYDLSRCILRSFFCLSMYICTCSTDIASGVPDDDISFMQIKSSYFGTWGAIYTIYTNLVMYELSQQSKLLWVSRKCVRIMAPFWPFSWVGALCAHTGAYWC